MKWRSKYFVDLALPFGLRSATYIFNSVADMVEWILLNTHHVSDLMHYLGDFITVGPPDSAQCALNLHTAMSVCKKLGLSLHPGECVGPSTQLIVLGIGLDLVELCDRIPGEKLAALQDLISSWRSRRWCSRQQLESLIGHLQHAAKVVWPGHAFLCCMIDLLCCFRRRNHPIRLNAEFHLDVLWWHDFLSTWHGMSFWLFPGMSAASDLEVTPDAAGSLGFGAFFSGAWVPCQFKQSIEYMELFPVVIEAHVWGLHWFRQHILFQSDNEASVNTLNSRTSKVPCLMFLLRKLLFAAAQSNFTFAAQYLPGIHNAVTDALSRLHWQEFRRLAPEAHPVPVDIPQSLLEDLIYPLSRGSAASSW